MLLSIPWPVPSATDGMRRMAGSGVNYTHVPQRPVAHHSAAVQAQAIDGINVLPLLPKTHVERYRGRQRCRLLTRPTGVRKTCIR